MRDRKHSGVLKLKLPDRLLYETLKKWLLLTVGDISLRIPGLKSEREITRPKAKKAAGVSTDKIQAVLKVLGLTEEMLQPCYTKGEDWAANRGLINQKE